MSKQSLGTVTNITPLSHDIFKVTVKLEKMPTINPGQFLNVKVPKFTLRRPFGISHFDESAKTISFCFQIRGGGTKALADIKVGEKLDLLLPLGNGFPVKKYKKVMLVGGGIGVFPLLPAAKDAYAFLGFRNKDAVVLEADFKKVTKELNIITQGFATDNLQAHVARIKPNAIFACGPLAMFKSLKALNLPVPVYVSLEERMACGFGVCACCTVDTARGKERVCCEGPVFLISEVNL